MSPQPEAWLRGPLPGMSGSLQPVAHALVQAREDLDRAVASMRQGDLWAAPGEAAPAGYHLKHLAGSLDRLMTYARGESLTDLQRSVLAEEHVREGTAADLLARAHATIDAALGQLAATPDAILTDTHAVGRACRPATVLGLLVHAGEHTARHVGQLITTAKAVRGIGTRVVATLRCRDAAAAVEWLCRAFGFTPRLVVPGEDDTVVHAQLVFGSGMVMLGQAREHDFDRLQRPPERDGVTTQSVYVIVPDADAHHAQAVAAGAEVVMALRAENHGGRGYSCRDPEGHLWNFGTYDPWAAG